jgi:epoxyqueuosine reductase QueG
MNAIPPDELAARCRMLALEMGASLTGIADLTRAYETCPNSFTECGPLLTGISIAVPEDDELIDGLPQTDELYRTSHYNEKISLALEIADRICEMLTAAGYRAHRLSHPPSQQPTGLFKLTARFAGLGWIGRNRLLITLDHGPRVALSVVLTDAPLPPTAAQPMPDMCGDCTLCLDACPVTAYSYDRFGETDSMQGFDTGRCSIQRGIINPTGWGVCGLCVQVCPFGKREK